MKIEEVESSRVGARDDSENRSDQRTDNFPGSPARVKPGGERYVLRGHRVLGLLAVAEFLETLRADPEAATAWARDSAPGLVANRLNGAGCLMARSSGGRTELSFHDSRGAASAALWAPWAPDEARA